MKLGVLTDTHNNLTNVREIVSLFCEHGVDHLIHTGDVTQPAVLETLNQVGVPVTGVFGNNDQGELSRLRGCCEELGFAFYQPPHRLTLDRRKVLLAHDPLEVPNRLDGIDLVVYGHTHRLLKERRNGALVFNPGECAGHMKGHNTVGIINLETLDVELLHF